MATITALQINKYGTSDEVHAVNIPKPQITKNTEILVRVKVASVNPADFLFLTDNYNQKAESFPARLGFEAAGIIEEVGKDTKFKVGQRIHFISLGAWGEYIVLDTSKVQPVPIPDSLSFEDAAQLTVNPITAIGLLDVLNPKEGEFLVQNAASSALAKIVIQLAKLKGIKTINVVRRDEHFEALKALGADYVINSEKEDVVKRVQEITQGGAHYGLDAIAGKAGADLVKSLKEDGFLLNYGVLGGFSLDVDISSLLFKSLTVKGFYVYNWTTKRGEKLKLDYEFLFDSLATKKIILPSQTFDGKTQYKEALKHAQTPGKAEKTVIFF